ncbi:MAG: SipW-dependent-type signal peptide-containing protein [Clostridia bacterium]|nr:SipW-dependent-type signal peptide-containing protein [Clostridia bacterium]
MTKLKSKKMTKSTFAIIIMAIAMVALMAFGGTYAYFTATTDKKSVTGLSTGTVHLTASAIAASPDAATIENNKVVPGQKVAGRVTIANASDVSTYVFVKIVAQLEGVDASNQVTDEDDLAEGKYMLDFADGVAGSGEVAKTLTQYNDGSKDIAGVYYFETAPADANKTLAIYESVTFKAISTSTEATAGTLMGKTLTLTFATVAIQKATFDTVQDAYAEVSAKLA